jgi:single-strand DNA-binding protein
VSDNTVTLVGNIVDSPRLARAGNGNSVANFRLAATQRYFDQAQGGYVDGNTLWIDVACWGELGGNVARSLAKGDPVVVRGTIYTDTWESDTGRRSSVKVKAAQVGPNLARGYCDFHRSVRGQAGAGSTAAEPDDSAADQRSPADGSSDLDYRVVADAFDRVSFEEPASEPAHV